MKEIERTEKNLREQIKERKREKKIVKKAKRETEKLVKCSNFSELNTEKDKQSRKEGSN